MEKSISFIDTVEDYGDSEVSKLIKSFKYGRSRRSLREISSRFYETLIFDFYEMMDFSEWRWRVVFVPKNFVEILLRGFNNNLLLAKALCRKNSIFKLEKRALKKIRLTKRQAGLNREERLVNLHGAFVVQHGSLLSAQKTLLIDDVVTTGSTLREVGKVILETKPIYLKTFAFACQKLK